MRGEAGRGRGRSEKTGGEVKFEAKVCRGEAKVCRGEAEAMPKLSEAEAIEEEGRPSSWLRRGSLRRCEAGLERGLGEAR
jgi:hypothetical protein